MQLSGRIIAGLALASLVFAVPAVAQDSGSMQVGNTAVTVGGGTAILTLPDVPSLMLRGANNNNGVLLETFKSSDDFSDEVGWNVNGSIEVPTGAAQTLSLNGFWARIEDDDTARCSGAGATRCFVAPLVDNPAIQDINGTGGVAATSLAQRDVDHWGVSLESKWTRNPGVMGVTQAPPRRYFAVAADIRGIDQDLSESISGAVTATYREDLDTRYYGAYAAWGRDYTLPFLSGMASGLGLQSSFLLRGGVYYADTEYDGRLTSTAGGGPGNPTSNLSLSSNDIAFIGGLVLETRKILGRRAILSLKSEYEYYSWVPEMAYNQADRFGANLASPNGQIGTRLGDDDAFSARTSLRLTIKLGPDSIMEPQP